MQLCRLLVLFSMPFGFRDTHFVLTMGNRSSSDPAKAIAKSLQRFLVLSGCL